MSEKSAVLTRASITPNNSRNPPRAAPQAIEPNPSPSPVDRAFALAIAHRLSGDGAGYDDPQVKAALTRYLEHQRAAGGQSEEEQPDGVISGWSS